MALLLCIAATILLRVRYDGCRPIPGVTTRTAQLRKISDTIARLSALRTQHSAHAADHGGRDRLQALTDFGSNPGALKGRVHLPPDLPKNAPLVVVLHGWRDAGAGGTTRREIHGEFMDRIAEEERLLAEAVSGVRAEHPDVHLESEAIPVVAWSALADASAAATLVVVGSRGRGAFAGMLLGSVSADVVRNAASTVLVLHDGLHAGPPD